MTDKNIVDVFWNNEQAPNNTCLEPTQEENLTVLKESINNDPKPNKFKTILKFGAIFLIVVFVSYLLYTFVILPIWNCKYFGGNKPSNNENLPPPPVNPRQYINTNIPPNLNVRPLPTPVNSSTPSSPPPPLPLKSFEKYNPNMSVISEKSKESVNSVSNKKSTEIELPSGRSLKVNEVSYSETKDDCESHSNSSSGENESSENEQEISFENKKSHSKQKNKEGEKTEEVVTVLGLTNNKEESVKNNSESEDENDLESPKFESAVNCEKSAKIIENNLDRVKTLLDQ